jgi:hypothetical protein
MSQANDRHYRASKQVALPDRHLTESTMLWTLYGLTALALVAIALVHKLLAGD